ncbi:MAG: alpha/beta fold hydrolase [Acidimicrobiales bacterium]
MRARTRSPKRRLSVDLLGVLQGALALALILPALALVPLATPAVAATPSLSSRLLSISDMPPGWRAVHHVDKKDFTGTLCSASLTGTKGWKEVHHEFTQGPTVPSVDEALFSGPSFETVWRKNTHELSQCHHATLSIDGAKYGATISNLALPSEGTASLAFQWAYTVSGIAFWTDLALIDVDGVELFLTYSDIASPPLASFEAYVTSALAKVNGASGRVVDAASVASSPVMIAHTRLGTIGYRTLGSGPSLVMIMGYAGTMTTWDPLFVDALAQHFRVVIFDNAGMGDTRKLSKPLTIDAMANQTSALISALGISRADILGWSMGGMIAQALAVLHPTQVNRLVLCATFPGTGKIDRPLQAVVNSLTNPSLPQAETALFPANQRVELLTYQLALSRYPTGRSISAADIAAQASAITKWWDGADPAGKITSSINVPTLVADGKRDNLDPSANDRALAKIIRGARLSLYSDAGHAFLFQDESIFAAKVESFLL